MNNERDYIALLGTSADPPTYGHQALLEGLLKLFPKVVTWASDNPMKLHGASLYHRQVLLNALVQSIANPKLEMVQDLSSPWTITTLQKASSYWPKADLIFVIGSDLVEQIPTWVEAKAVLKNARLGIAPRHGWPLNQCHIKTLESLGARIEILPLTIPASASSIVRKNPNPNRRHIPSVLLPLLLEQNLYGLSSSL